MGLLIPNISIPSLKKSAHYLKQRNLFTVLITDKIKKQKLSIDMNDVYFPRLGLEEERIEATVRSEKMLFSNELDDRGYILDTEDGRRKWSFKDDVVEGDDFGKGDHIEILLKERRKMKPWVGSRSLSDGEPERRFVVEKISSEKKEELP